MNASIIANLYSTRRFSMGIIAAFDSKKLTPTLEKVWNELTFLNDSTDGGFFKLSQVLNRDDAKRASHYKMVNGLKIEDGWMSQIVGIVANTPNKIRGYRTDLLVFEEAGSWPGLKKAVIQGQALIGILGNLFGFCLLGGTGGDSGPALEGLRDIYYNPSAYNVLPFRHRFTSTGEQALTGYFLPAFSMVIAPGYIDERGYTDPVRAREYHEGERAKMAKDPKGLMIYQAEFCFNAEEAFALEGDNKFNKVVLSNLLASIRIHGLGPKIETGYLKATYKGNNADRKASEIVDLHWIEGDGGDVHIIEHPIWSNNYKRINEEGEEERFELMSNLYVAGIDSIDMGNDLTSDYTDDPSKFCIVIKKRARGVDPPMYVAYYLARPDKIRDAYLTAMKLMMYYNCRCNIEASRITMIQWAKLNEVLLYFINRPRATYPDPTKKVSKLIGTPATKYIIDHQTDLIANYVEDYGEHIWFPEMLDLLIRYNDENKGKFDIVAACGMAELADEEYTGVVPRIVDEEAENKWSDVGYYRDEKGVLHYGVRQIQRELKVSLNTEQDFTTRNRTSNPRYYVYD